MRDPRSLLSVPASSWRMVEKAASLPADAVFLDLEDSVAPVEKIASRAAVIRAAREFSWGVKSFGYRINAVDTPLCYRDVIDVVEQVGDRVHFVIVPKVTGARDVQFVDTLLTQIEVQQGFEPGEIKLHAIIETPQALSCIQAIATSTSRLEAFVLGTGDLAALMHMPMASIGAFDAWDDAYPGHRFHYAMARIAVAARAAGIVPLDGPLADFRDVEALRRMCGIARSLGYDGKWCIHPNQIEVVNEVFSPTEQEIEWAQRVVDAYQGAVAGGSAAVAVDGRMIDIASVQMAEATLKRVQRISAG